MKNLKNITAIVLSMLVLMNICSVSFPVIASYEHIKTEIHNESSANNPTIVSEIISKRNESTKHFLLSDGSFAVAKYNMPVHYKDENSEWKNIDNTLNKEKAAAGQFALFGTTDILSTKNAYNNFIFAEKSNSNTLLSYEDESYPISLNYQSAKNSSIQVIEKSTAADGDNEFLLLNNVSQTVLYENIYEGVDLEYSVSPIGIKENIILKHKNTQSDFTVNYNIDNLTATLKDSHTIELSAENKVIYTITAPIMYDNSGEESDALSLSIEKNKNGKLRVVISADSEWLHSEERVYPVTLDPTISTETNRSAIDSVMIAENTPNTNYSTQGEMLVGRESSEYGYCRILTKFSLPTLNKGDMITGARLNLCNTAIEKYYEAAPDMQVNVHELTESWSLSGVTWNNQPSYKSTVVDYDIFESSDCPTWRYFDITRLAKKWYESPSNNFGIMLKCANTSGTLAENGIKAEIYSERYNYNESIYPSIYLTYSNNKGLEDYWSYTSASLSTGGTMYVNDYTGNPVFSYNIISAPNELLPLSVDIIYNGYASSEAYVAGRNKSYSTVIGKGWKMSVQQTLMPSSYYGLDEDEQDNYPYVYSDADGTEHYFYYDNEVYLDEDGLGLKMVVLENGSGYKITDKKDNVLIFNSQYNLTKIQNAHGQYTEMVFDSSGKKLERIIDATGKNYTLEYPEGSNRVAYITDPSGRSIHFTASSNLLTNVSLPDSTSVSFTYDSDNSITKAACSDNYALSFTYTDVATGKRVSTIKESGNGNVGRQIKFNRTKLNTTSVQTVGNDGEFDTDDDLITTYQFDNSGKTVSQQLKTKKGTDSVAGTYTYTEKSDTALKANNKLSGSAGLGKNIVNYLKNGSFERNESWAHDNKLGCEGSLSFTDTDSYLGKDSLLVSNTSVTDSTSRYDIAQTADNLKAGKKYTLSAYVKITEIGNIQPSDKTGAYVCIMYTDTQGENHPYYSEAICEATDTAINNGWRRISVTRELPEDVTAIRAYLSLRGCTGKAYFDAIQLEEGGVANAYNLLENSSFEKVTSGIPDKWTAKNTQYITSGDTVYEGSSSAYKKNGSKSVIIKGDALTSKSFYQKISVKDEPNQSYIVSGWGKANAVSEENHHDEAAWQIAIQVHYRDEDGNIYKEYKDPAVFNPDVSDWQYTAKAFTLKSTEHPSYTPVFVCLWLKYNHQVNYAYFDHIQLLRDSTSTYSYDSEGNLVSATSSSEHSESMEYDDKSDPESYTDVLGNKTTYSYSDTHLLESSTSPGNVKTEYNYNAAGQNTSVASRNTFGNYVIKTSTGYTSSDEASGVKAGAYVRATADEHGNRTTYNYDYLKGLVTSVKTPDNVTTSYNYDSNDRLTMVNSEGSSVSYTYNSDNRLSKITFGNDNYTFTYDDFGNIKSTSVNGQVLSENTYAAKNGNLTKTTYGNGAIKQFNYDTFGNVTSILNGAGTKLFSWTYDSAMSVTRHSDHVNHQIYDYDYDSLGRLAVQYVTSTDGERDDIATQFSYDKRNNTNKIINSAGGYTSTQRYYYTAIDSREDTARYAKDNLPTRYSMLSGYYTDYEYDSFNRLNKTVLHLNNVEKNLITSYSYKKSERNGENETTYRTTQLSTEAINDKAYTYFYDVMGNITSVRVSAAENGVKTGDGEDYKSYTYDDLGRLTRENNKATNKTYTYSYDSLGNIKSKKIYAYTTGSLTGVTPTEAYTYTYGTDSKAKWSKLLTSFNGESIIYDKIGNPTTYRGDSLTWDGRQLVEYGDIEYTYDSDGLRSSKTVDGVTTTYQYLDGQLVYENRGGARIHYYYDSYGNPAAIRYIAPGQSVGTRYYYTTNSLGDVIGIYNGNGQRLVRYEYDAWGNVSVHTNTSSALSATAIAIAEINPLRYRGYYYDTDTRLYYLQSRYYDSEVGRFINSDSQISGVGGEIQGYNTYSYCANNPVNLFDPTGHWPKWLDGALNTIGGIAEIAAGAALWASTCLSGVGIVAGGLLMADGLARVAQGAHQISNSVAGTNYREDNMARSLVTYTGQKVGGDTGAKVAGAIYDTAVFVAGIYSMAKAPSQSACFVAGTFVLTASGNKAIEEIRAEDWVWAENPKTGEKALKKVARTFIDESYELVRVFVNKEEIVTTPEHPFYVPVSGWTSAISLRAGDILVLQDGNYVVVEKIQHEILEEPVRVYNFEVEDFHTYYVGKSSVLVHNKCGPLKGKDAVDAADKLGFKPVKNQFSHGQRVFFNSKKGLYITPDTDSHIGGVWKMAKSIKALGSKSTRMGTFDEFLNIIGE